MAPTPRLVELDLNNPEFQRTWVELEPAEAERVRAAFRKILRLTWSELYSDKGLHWGKVRSLAPPDGVDALYTFRLSRSAGTVGYREGNFLRVLLVSADHDSTYGRP